jgi:hypothetical protein
MKVIFAMPQRLVHLFVIPNASLGNVRANFNLTDGDAAMRQKRAFEVLLLVCSRNAEVAKALCSRLTRLSQFNP